MSYLLCRHIKADGVVCGSPALSNTEFCYHHYRWRKRRSRVAPQPAPAAPRREKVALALEPIDDPGSLQTAISTVTTALAANRIDHRRASALLYGLHLSATNMQRIRQLPPPDFD